MKLSIRWSLWGILLLSSVLACKEPEKTTLCFVKTWTVAGPGKNVVTTFNYEGTLLVSAVTVDNGVTTNTKYAYDGIGRLAQSVVKDASGAILSTEGHLYDSISRLVVSHFNLPGDTLEAVYFYNLNNQLVTARKEHINMVPTVITIDSYSYPDVITHNPSSISSVTGAADPVVTTFTYDDKINPFRGYLPTIQPYNNVTLKSVDGVQVSYSYQYNSLGYPISVTSSDGYTYTFTYVCIEV